MKFLRTLIIIQSCYTFITAVWPLIDIKSFMEITGYKTDVWLVKTVGALLIPIALALVMHVFINANYIIAAILGSTTAIAFIWIDFYYALSDVISKIYLADGCIQIVFLLMWLYITFTKVLTRPPSQGYK